MADYREKYFTETYDEYIDPSLRSAVNNIANSAISRETDPDKAISKGQLQIKEPAKYSYGSPINDAIMKKAKDKFYDPEMDAGMQKLRYINNQANNLQNSANNIIKIYQLDKQAESIVRQRKAAEDSQRASVISSVLGLGGAVIGAAYGGAAGAAVGAQAGSSVGTAVSK